MSADSGLNTKRVAIIGAGFSGISAAAYLAKAGCQVDVYEKNESTGGRARQFRTDSGFVFDMGPSWYWMPDVFERFFADFGYRSQIFMSLSGLILVFQSFIPTGRCSIYRPILISSVPCSMV